MKKNIGSFSLMKNMNMSLILSKIQEHTLISRAQIAKETGLTAATVTNLTSELIGDGVVIECDTGNSTGGRKPIMLKMDTEKFGVCAAYISPDKVEFVAANLISDIIYYSSIPFDRKNKVSDCIDFISDEYLKIVADGKRKILGLTVGLHGLVNSSDGVSVFAPNLEWENVDIAKILKPKVNVPIFTDNDVRLMTLGEMWFGNAKNVKDMFYMYIGKGIGGTLVINGELYRGFGSGAGEIGHCIVKKDGPVCFCGNNGCLQTAANTDAMKNSINEILKSNKYKTALTHRSTLANLIHYHNIGDSGAKAVIDNISHYLAMSMGTVVNLINPQTIILDSSVKGFSEAAIPYIYKYLPKHCMKYQRSECKIIPSKLEEMAVLKGGAALAIKNMYENPDILKRANM